MLFCLVEHHIKWKTSSSKQVWANCHVPSVEAALYECCAWMLIIMLWPECSWKHLWMILALLQWPWHCWKCLSTVHDGHGWINLTCYDVKVYSDIKVTIHCRWLKWPPDVHLLLYSIQERVGQIVYSDIGDCNPNFIVVFLGESTHLTSTITSLWMYVRSCFNNIHGNPWTVQMLYAKWNSEIFPITVG